MQYDTPTTSAQVNQALAATTGLAPETRQQIEQILGTAPGGTSTTVDVGFFDGSSLSTPSSTPVDMLIIAPPPPSSPNTLVSIVIPPTVLQTASAYVFEGNVGVEVTFNTVERVIAAGQGGDRITVNGDRNTTLDGSGGNDTLVTSGGNDSITGGDGNDSITSGAGNDTIVSGMGDDTIDGGAGRDAVTIAGSKANYTVTVVDGDLRVTNKTNTSVESKISNVEFVGFNNGESIAVAANTDEAEVLRLYQAVLGRDADKAGADYWVNVLNTKATSDVGIANAFLNSTELNVNGPLSNEQFINALYANALDRAADEAGKAYWLNDLANGQERANIAINIVGSAEAASHIDGVIIITGQI